MKSNVITRRKILTWMLFYIWILTGICSATNINSSLGERFNTKGHQKSKGINMSIAYPDNWVAREGERPNILRTFSSVRPWGGAIIMLGIRDIEGVSSKGFTSNQEAAAYLTSKHFLVSQFGDPPIAEVTKTKLTTIESLPALTIEYEGKQSRLGNEWNFISWSLHTIVGGALVTLDCRLLAASEYADQLSFRLEEMKPLFLNMANSIVIENVYDHPSPRSDSHNYNALYLLIFIIVIPIIINLLKSIRSKAPRQHNGINLIPATSGYQSEDSASKTLSDIPKPKCDSRPKDFARKWFIIMFSIACCLTVLNVLSNANNATNELIENVVVYSIYCAIAYGAGWIFGLIKCHAVKKTEFFQQPTPMNPDRKLITIVTRI